LLSVKIRFLHYPSKISFTRKNQIPVFPRWRRKHVSHFRMWNSYSYVESISESFLPITNKCNVKTGFSIFNTLRKFFNFGKDPLHSLSHNDVVYKISCQDCEATYVGQTKSQLKTRLQEHSADIKKKNDPPSVISNHRINDNHDFNWIDIEILEHERNYNKRLMFEMLVHIIKQRHGLNKQTEFLPEAYYPLLNLLSPPLRIILSYCCSFLFKNNFFPLPLFLSLITVSRQ